MSTKQESPSDDKNSLKSPDEEVKDMTAEVEMLDIGGDEFSLVVLADHFSKCLKNPELTLVEYIAGYKEVYKFLALLVVCLVGLVVTCMLKLQHWRST